MVFALKEKDSEEISTAKIPNTNLTACKLLIDRVIPAEESGDRATRLSQNNLRKIYESTTLINMNSDINYFISNGFIFLIPESGEGYAKDLHLMTFSMEGLLN